MFCQFQEFQAIDKHFLCCINLSTLQNFKRNQRSKRNFPTSNKHSSVVGIFYSKVVSPHLRNTPLNLYQQAIKGFLVIPFIVGERGIAWGVLEGSGLGIKSQSHTLYTLSVAPTTYV